ncbi:endo-1,4-beta-xylanase [Paenibacillus sp. F411]|nr:endo-1,4-beta-xylanase [Paenibacillus sp. F411]
MVRTFKQMMAAVLAAVLFIPALPPEAAAASTSVVYEEHFENGTSVAAASGNARLDYVSDKPFELQDDAAALYVHSRSNDWDAADFTFEDIGLENGVTYTVTASVYVDTDVPLPAGAKAALQTVNSYSNHVEVDYKSGGTVILEKEFTADQNRDVALRIKSNEAGAAVPFYIGHVLITKTPGTDPEQPPSAPVREWSTITFEHGQVNGFEGRKGTEQLTLVSGENHSSGGSFALKTEGRSDTWHGPSLRIDPYIVQGAEYTISAWVKLISPESADLQLSTQIGTENSASYVTLDKESVTAESGWIELKGTYRYNNVSSGVLTIYVESSSSTASFYLDDVHLERTDSGPIAIQPDLEALKDVYASQFLIGAAITAEDLEGIRLELLSKHHNTATAENAMKPEALQPQKGTYTFEAADQMVNAALDAGLRMHGHVLVWHQQSPAWMTTRPGEGSSLDREEALDNMRTHIRAVMEHFGDRMISWDVVNEAINDNPSSPEQWKGSLRQSPWYHAIGPDYVEQAFLAAREVLDENPDWDIKLYYNDYNEDNRNKATAIYHMVKEINERYSQEHPGKLLIDGIGMQGHYGLNTNPDNVKASLERFISLGVEISITELDIQAGSDYQMTKQQADAQGYIYARLFQLYEQYAEHISRVTFWGLEDSKSWRAAFNPLVFDRNLQAKPAYYGIVDPDTFIAGYQPVLPEGNFTSASYAASPVAIDGIEDAAWNSATAIPVNQYQMAWQGATGTAKALWDDQYLYVLVKVNDGQLDKSSPNPWEQDSIEVFVDENNEKTTYYQQDDGQYRVNYDNETSFNPEPAPASFKSSTRTSGSMYTVELQIPLREVKPGNGARLGFDVQINDARNGARQSVAAWNDTTGNAYMDTSVFGTLHLTGKPAAGSSDMPGSIITVPANNPDGSVTVHDGVITLKPQAALKQGRMQAVVSAALLQKALQSSQAAGERGRQMMIDVPGLKGTAGLDLQLPMSELQALEGWELVIPSGAAKLTIPGQALHQATKGKDIQAQGFITLSLDHHVSLRPGMSMTPLPGNRPALRVSLLHGDTLLPWDQAGMPIQTEIFYTPSAAEANHQEQIVVWHMDDQGVPTPVVSSRYDDSTQAVRFSMKKLGTYAVTYAAKPFADVTCVPWAEQAVHAMAARGVIQGTTPQTFSPGDTMTRAGFAALLVRMLDLPAADLSGRSFSDAAAANALQAEVAAALELGIISGYADGTFRPEQPLKRQDMMVMAVRALKAGEKTLGEPQDLTRFKDAAALSGYAKESAAIMTGEGLVHGRNQALAPQELMTRAEAAVILYRIWSLE